MNIELLLGVEDAERAATALGWMAEDLTILLDSQKEYPADDEPSGEPLEVEIQAVRDLIEHFASKIEEVADVKDE